MKRNSLFSSAYAASLSVMISLGYAISSGYVNILLLLHDQRVLDFTTQFFHTPDAHFYA